MKIFRSPFPPLTEAQLDQGVETARRLCSIESGGLISGAPVPRVGGRAGLRVTRQATREPIEFPSLVDERLVWLALEDWSPGAEISVMWFGDDHEVVLDCARKNAFTHVEINVGRLAWDAVRSLTVGLLPPVGLIETGRGAWEYASERVAEGGPCTACPFRLGSNLDCETCRAHVLARKEPTATWRRYHVRDGIIALEFDEDIAEEAAAAAERALAQVDAPILTHQFFHQWSIRFAQESAGVFAYEDDHLIARDLIEAQMLAPWFALPPQLPPREALDVPPAVSEATIKSQARTMIRGMMERGARRRRSARWARSARFASSSRRRPSSSARARASSATSGSPGS